MENVLLPKAVQFRPQWVYVMTWDKNLVESFDPTWLNTILRRHGFAEGKPLCNVVLFLDGSQAPDAWDWWEFPACCAAVVNGFRANGYGIEVTADPLTGADACYVCTRGVFGDWGEPALDLPAEIVQLFDSGKPVFLQLTQILPNSTANWNTVRSRLGIDGADFAQIESSGSILLGDYEGISYPHLRASEPAHRTYLNAITPDHVVPPAEVLSTGEVRGITCALLTRNGENYLVNGTAPELRAAFPVSHLLNDGLQRPTACVASSGNTSVFYALDQTLGQPDTSILHIKLPGEVPGFVRWTRRTFEGSWGIRRARERGAAMPAQIHASALASNGTWQGSGSTVVSP